jgi:hypothetical protein
VYEIGEVGGLRVLEVPVVKRDKKYSMRSIGMPSFVHMIAEFFPVRVRR